MTRYLSLLSILFFPTWTTDAQAAPTEKYALIIAIAKYEYWSYLSSDNDLVLMQSTLERQGFSRKNIRTIENEKATKKGIEAELEQLIKRVPSGSVVVIHYSGHGQQISDDNGDEVDGLDETLVPYDAPMTLDQIKSYDGSLHLRDDELKIWADRLRAKLGTQGHLLILLDSCHSGSASRGTARVRGGAAALLLPGAPQPNESEHESGSGLFEGERSKVGDESGLSNYVVVSGAKANEENKEVTSPDGLALGSLTYAVSQTWANLNAGQIGYYEWFGRIMNNMATSVPRQTPTIEGDFDATLLSGEYVRIKPYFNILEILEDGDEIRLDGGQLMGVFEKCKIAIFGSESAPIAHGVVTRSNALLSLVKLNGKLAPTATPREIRAYITEQTFGDLNVQLKIESEDETIQDSLSAIPYIVFTRKPPFELVLKGQPGDFQLLNAADGAPLGRAMRSISDCRDGIREYVQAKLLKTVDLVADSTIQISSKVTPVEVQADKLTGRRIKQEVSYPLGNIPSFRSGMYADFKFSNEGQSTVFITGVDIMPDNRVAVLFPKNTEQPAEYKIDAGKTKVIEMKFAPPFGTETIKVYATTSPIDLRPVVSSRGGPQPGPQHPFETFLRKTYVRTRSGQVDAPPVQSGAVLTYTFKMIE